MLNAAARTHAGRVRPQNEDALVCRPEQGLFAVVDGMGGEAAGEVAAAIAAAAIAAVPDERRRPSETVLVEALRRAREQILAEQRARPEHGSMGAVATALRFEDDGRTVGVAHVGDTRLYLVSEGRARQLTEDHLAAGVGKRPVARDLGRRELPDPWVATGRYRVRRGDLLVLCTDGLYDPVGDDALAGELVRHWQERTDADAVAAKLVALALARGGPDNVTVVAVRVGPFRRGRSRRLGLLTSLGLFAVLLGLAAGVAAYRRGSGAETLPARVTGVRELARVDRYALAPGAALEVAPGAALTLRGAALDGVDWTVRLGEGAVLTLDRSVVTLRSGWTVELGPGAELFVRDTRLEAGAVTVRADPSARLRLQDVGLRVDAGWPPPGVVLEAERVHDLAAPPVAPPAGAAPDAAPPAGAAPDAPAPVPSPSRGP